MRVVNEIVERLHGLPLPTIAKVDGVAVGAGWNLALAWVRGPDEIDAFVDDLAARLAAGPPVAMALSKALLAEGTSRGLADSLAAEARAQTVNLATDGPAAYRAFLDKVDPTFTGEWQLGRSAE